MINTNMTSYCKLLIVETDDKVEILFYLFSDLL